VVPDNCASMAYSRFRRGSGLGKIEPRAVRQSVTMLQKD